MTDSPEPGHWQVAIPELSLTLQVSAAETLLSGLQEAGVPVRHACRNGVCEICEARLITGTVEQHYPALSIEAAVDAPLIRLCAAYARSDLKLQLMPYAIKR